MTGYYIEVGYNSAHSKEEVGEKLKAIVAEIRNDPQQIIQELLRVESGNAAELAEYAELYRPPEQDLTVRVRDNDGLPQIVQLASGGGTERDKKEAMRRAFCRLVLAKMHSAQMEVNIHVG